MNASDMARTAYAQPASPVQTDRGTEYAAFEQVTSGLTRAEPESSPIGQRAAALHNNRRLWTLLAADVAGAENGLPDNARAQILYLCQFTLHHSRRVLYENAPIRPLIEINTAMMRGLRGEAEPA